MFRKQIAVIFLMLLPLSVWAQQSYLQSITLESGYVPGAAEIAVLHPAEVKASEGPLPLILFFHGGGGSSSDLNRFRPIIEEAWKRNILPPAVVAMPSAERSFYLDFQDNSQQWETFVLSDLIPHLRANFNVVQDASGTVIMGISMGGMGSLRMAFKDPTSFLAVAALEPAIEAAYSYDTIEAIDRTYRSEALYQSLFGNPVDRDYWQLNHPPYIARENMETLKDSGLNIYIEVGNEDRLNLFRGGEMLHRLLFDAGLKHEYRLVHRADHTGESIPPRVLNAFDFVGRTLRGSFAIEK